MRKKVIQKLEKLGFDKDNLAGVIAILDNCDDDKCFDEMLRYLEKDNLVRNDIFEYAFEITQTEFDEFEIIDR